MKRLTLKRHFTLLVMAAFWTTASPIGVDSIKDSNNDSVNEVTEHSGGILIFSCARYNTING